jgi:signal peptidase I
VIRKRAVHRTLRVLRELALTAGAVAGTLCLLFALLGAAADVRPLVFTSGSMAPAIRTGDLAITRPVERADISPGDVVSVLDARGMRVTHRVVEVDTARNLLRLKGDANNVVDPLPYPADRVDRVLFAVPAGGYVLTWLDSPTAMLLLGGYLAFVLWTLRPRGGSPTSPVRPRGGRHAARHRVGSVIGAGLVLGLAATGFPAPTPTLAAYTGSVPITGSTLAAYTVTKPVITNCTSGPVAVTVTWSAVSSPYALTYQAVVVESGRNLTVTGSGGTRSATYDTTLDTLGSTARTIRITAALPSASSWTSIPSNQTVNLSVVGLVPSCGASS